MKYIIGTLALALWRTNAGLLDERTDLLTRMKQVEWEKSHGSSWCIGLGTYLRLKELGWTL